MSEFIEVEADYRSIASRGLVHGLGVNDVEYYVQTSFNGKYAVCPYYSKWKSIMSCLQSDNRYSICDDWVYLSKFKAWMEEQDHKDKQINTVISGVAPFSFSPSNCVFVNKSISSLINRRDNLRGELPIGVSIKDGSFRVSISVDGKRKHVGIFPTLEAAASAYNDKKYNLIVDKANEQECAKTKRGLLLWAEKFKDGLID